MDLKERAKKLKTDIPAVLLALKRKETPIVAKVLAAVTVCYALSPIDLIPDFIPVLGYLDDLILLPCLIAFTVKLIPQEVFKECQEQAVDLWSEEKQTKWYYAIPFVAVWLVVLWIIVKVIWL